MSSFSQLILSHLENVDADTAAKHFDRFDEEYLERFDEPTVATHLQCLSQIAPTNPVEVLLADDGDGQAQCTVIAFDHPFEFSLIVGVLAGTGFRIESGDVFTLPKVETGEGQRHVKRGPGGRPVRRPTFKRTALNQSVIIDHFQGRLEHTDYNKWADDVAHHLQSVLMLLDKNEESSVKQTKQRVNKLVTARLSTLERDHKPMLFPVNLDIEPGESFTRLTIDAQDTPAFLYSLSTALSLRGLSIERVVIRSKGNLVEDQIHVVDAKGKPIADQRELEQIRLSVLLTKQFTYFLDSSPDPYTALTRFEKMTEQITNLPDQGQWLDLLGNPRAMQEFAKLLGASDFLWEDFIRQQAESLLPIFKPHLTEGKRFCEPTETIPHRLEQALQGAVGLAEQQDRLNRFKDNETFMIDLDHILTPGSDFRDLSERLTFLAENLTSTAAQLIYDDLVRAHGKPQKPDGSDAPFALFGLGKLGGIALGYASDVELLFVYDGAGNTGGGKYASISNAEFFERLVQEAAKFIKTKRAGIFEVDLRLRPHGNDGPLACSFDQFNSYYAHDGEAHPFERLALVRLRWIGGDASLGYAVEQLRHQFVYELPNWDIPELLRIWKKQRQEKNQPGKLNAKYSPGALVDLEGTVQLLQVQHARSAPQSHTPRLRGAMEGLQRAKVLTPKEYAELSGAYHFLRKLINALRMLRGNAQDLFLPDQTTDEFTHLARRVGYVGNGSLGPAEQLSQDFERHTSAVAAFVEKHFGADS